MTLRTLRASATAAKNELRAASTAGAGSSNALHAMDYMIYGHLQLAQDQAAKRIVDEVQAIQTINVEGFGAAYALAAIPARYALERHRWDEAMGLQLHPKDLAWDPFPSAGLIPGPPGADARLAAPPDSSHTTAVLPAALVTHSPLPRAGEPPSALANGRSCAA